MSPEEGEVSFKGMKKRESKGWKRTSPRKLHKGKQGRGRKGEARGSEEVDTEPDSLIHMEANEAGTDFHSEGEFANQSQDTGV